MHWRMSSRKQKQATPRPNTHTRQLTGLSFTRTDLGLQTEAFLPLNQSKPAAGYEKAVSGELARFAPPRHALPHLNPVTDVLEL